MASTTTRLNLLKKNPLTDGADTFNIETMLNENWQKIDDKVATLGADGKVPAEQLNIDTSSFATKTEVTTHMAEKASKTVHGHVKVGAGITVEDGEISVSEMTASNVTTTQGPSVQASLDSLKLDTDNKIQSAAAAVISKGGTVAGNPPTAAQLVSGIGSIPTPSGVLDKEKDYFSSSRNLASKSGQMANFNDFDYRGTETGGNWLVQGNPDGTTVSITDRDINGSVVKTVVYTIPVEWRGTAGARLNNIIATSKKWFVVITNDFKILKLTYQGVLLSAYDFVNFVPQSNGRLRMLFGIFDNEGTDYVVVVADYAGEIQVQVYKATNKAIVTANMYGLGTYGDRDIIARRLSDTHMMLLSQQTPLFLSYNKATNAFNAYRMTTEPINHVVTMGQLVTILGNLGER